jgi:hypothetical protein
MSDAYGDQKRRPPPITIPSLPVAPPRSTQVATTSQTKPIANDRQHQRDVKYGSGSSQNGPRSATTPLTSPLDELGLPQSTSKTRANTTTTLPGVMEQAPSSPQKSNYGSTSSSRHGSTTCSRHSVRSHQSAVVARPQLEAVAADERTSRGMIESRTERSLFKMTGQVPPTPIAGRCCPSIMYLLADRPRIPW